MLVGNIIVVETDMLRRPNDWEELRDPIVFGCSVTIIVAKLPIDFIEEDTVISDRPTVEDEMVFFSQKVDPQDFKSFVEHEV